MSEHLLLFVIANSFFISIFPLVYLWHIHEGLTEEEKQQSRLSLASINIVIPIAMGVLFAGIYSFIRPFVSRKVSGFYLRFSVAGALSAFLVSLGLDYFLNLYDTWLESDNPWMIHLMVAAFYFVIYQIIGVWVYKRIGDVFCEPDTPAPTRSVPVSLKAFGGSTSSTSSSSGSSSSSENSVKSELYDKLSKRSGGK